MSEVQKKLVIVGTGPQAQIARDYFEEFSNYEVIGFACHNKFKESDEIYCMPLLAIEDLPEKCPGWARSRESRDAPGPPGRARGAALGLPGGLGALPGLLPGLRRAAVRPAAWAQPCHLSADGGL